MNEFVFTLLYFGALFFYHNLLYVNIVSALFLLKCAVSMITERKTRATKRSSVDVVGKMPFCVFEVERLFFN